MIHGFAQLPFSPMSMPPLRGGQLFKSKGGFHTLNVPRKARHGAQLYRKNVGLQSEPHKPVDGGDGPTAHTEVLDYAFWGPCGSLCEPAKIYDGPRRGRPKDTWARPIKIYDSGPLNLNGYF